MRKARGGISTCPTTCSPRSWRRCRPARGPRPRDAAVPSLTDARLRTAITKACKATGTPHFSPHGLRRRRGSLHYKRTGLLAKVASSSATRSGSPPTTSSTRSPTTGRSTAKSPLRESGERPLSASTPSDDECRAGKHRGASTGTSSAGTSSYWSSKARPLFNRRVMKGQSSSWTVRRLPRHTSTEGRAGGRVATTVAAASVVRRDGEASPTLRSRVLRLRAGQTGIPPERLELHPILAVGRGCQPAGMTWKGRIMSFSSCSRMWQWIG
jgi:hypothetical protein